jgi:hypothetical protein
VRKTNVKWRTTKQNKSEERWRGTRLQAGDASEAKGTASASLAKWAGA